MHQMYPMGVGGMQPGPAVGPDGQPLMMLPGGMRPPAGMMMMMPPGGMPFMQPGYV